MWLIPTRTARQVSARLSAVVARIDCNSIRLRYAWDNKRPALVGLDEWAAQTTAGRAAAITYHASDFVMLEPGDKGALLDIVQVHQIRSQDVYVRRLKRQALQSRAAFKHDRLLIPATQLERISRTTFAPVSKCHVSLLSATPSSWTCDDLYVTPKDAELLHAECTPCTVAYRVKRRQVRDTPKLTTMELMCGAGGLSVGLPLLSVLYCLSTTALAETAVSHADMENLFPSSEVHATLDLRPKSEIAVQEFEKQKTHGIPPKFEVLPQSDLYQRDYKGSNAFEVLARLDAAEHLDDCGDIKAGDTVIAGSHSHGAAIADIAKLWSIDIDRGWEEILVKSEELIWLITAVFGTTSSPVEQLKMDFFL